MNPKTIEALKGSIKKWRDILSGVTADRKSENCSLCKLFILDDCRECPVALSSKSIGCRSTPWMDWYMHHQGIHDAFYNMEIRRCKRCRELAERELAFLKGLLPKSSRGNRKVT